jgi:hypothetical protein
MERKGMFKVNPSDFRPNQCKVSGHEYYEYLCKIVFSEDTKLDSNQFVIDHQQVDNVIVNCKKIGSCEQYHTVMMNELINYFKKKEIPILAVKITIIPRFPDGQAQLSKIWGNKNNLKFLSL